MLLTENYCNFSTQLLFCTVPLCRSVCSHDRCLHLECWAHLSLLITNLKRYWTVGTSECTIWSVRQKRLVKNKVSIARVRINEERKLQVD